MVIQHAVTCHCDPVNSSHKGGGQLPLLVVDLAWHAYPSVTSQDVMLGLRCRCRMLFDWLLHGHGNCWQCQAGGMTRMAPHLGTIFPFGWCSPALGSRESPTWRLLFGGLDIIRQCSKHLRHAD